MKLSNKRHKRRHVALHYLYGCDPERPRSDLGGGGLDGLHALEFRCRCSEGCWINVETGLLIDVIPTHWHEWPSD